LAAPSLWAISTTALLKMRALFFTELASTLAMALAVVA
jgi:hypothetical protein